MKKIILIAAAMLCLAMISGFTGTRLAAQNYHGGVVVSAAELGPLDMLSLSGHKLYGPKGVGALYVRSGVRFTPQMFGGSHERNKRPGTENVAGIVGLGKAIELETEILPEKVKSVTTLRDKLIDGLMERIPDVRLNGERERRLPGNVNISVEYVEGESLLMFLDMNGIEASSGSACTSGSLDPSHVLMAIGLSHSTAQSSVRFSLGEFTTEEEIEYVLNVFPPFVLERTKNSPLFSQYKGGTTNV